MSYREENGQVVLTVSREDYEKVLLGLGAGLGAMIRTGRSDISGELALRNRLNEGNPNWTPYKIEEPKQSWKLTEKAEAALKEPDTKVLSVLMTPELREKLAGISDKVVDLLRAPTQGPYEAYIVLQYVMHGFEDMYGIRGGVVLTQDEKEQT